MTNPTRDWAQEQQVRKELAETVNMLASFIHQYSSLEYEQSRILALAIIENGRCSGVVPATRAARLLTEAYSDAHDSRTADY